MRACHVITSTVLRDGRMARYTVCKEKVAHFLVLFLVFTGTAATFVPFLATSETNRLLTRRANALSLTATARLADDLVTIRPRTTFYIFVCPNIDISDDFLKTLSSYSEEQNFETSSSLNSMGHPCCSMHVIFIA